MISKIYKSFKQNLKSFKMPKHSRINMANRLYVLSDRTIPDGVTEDEFRAQFRKRILPEWRELKNERGHQDPHDIADGTIPCVCGHKLSAKYFKIFNIINGEMAIVGSGCVKYVRDNNLQSLTPNQFKTIIRNKLGGALNNPKNKLFFKNIHEYSLRVMEIVTQDWSLVRTAIYLKAFSEYPRVTTILIDQLHAKALAAKKNTEKIINDAKKENSLNYDQKEVLREKERILIKKNYELQKKIDQLEGSIDEIEYENMRIKKLQQEFFESTY